MHSTKRTVIILSLWAFLFLLVALAPYIAVFFGLQDAAFIGVFVTPIFLIASEIATIRAIIARNRVTDTHKRRILAWSLLVIISALAALVILLGSYLIASTPYCTDPLTARGCVQNVGFPAYFSMGVFVAASLSGLVVAPIFALSDAARTGKWLWFVGILIYLLGSWAAAGSILILSGANTARVFTALDWLAIIRVVSPLLLPFITIWYSLSGREKAAAKDYKVLGSDLRKGY